MRKEILVLILIFLITLSCRLFIAFQNDEFSDDKAYFTLRQIENIKETGKLIGYDELSYSGKEQINSPFYYYFLTFFSFFMPINLVGKIIPNVLASLLVIIIYLISMHLNKNSKVSLIASFTSGFVPIYFSRTVNSISIYSLVIPLIFLMIYCLLKIDNKRFLIIFIIGSFILALTSASSFLLIIALLFYLLFLRLEKLRLTRREIKLILFCSFLIIIINFWIYKAAFLFHGTSLIWQNFPKEVMAKYFLEFNLLGALYLIGIVPFVSGVYIIYYNLFRKKKKSRFTFLLISFAISTGILLWFKLIQLRIGLMFLGIVLVLLFAQFMYKFWIYLNRTKFSKYKNHIFLVIFLLIILTSVWPSYDYSKREMRNIPNQDDVNALLWLKQNPGKTLNLLDEGNLIAYYGKSKNIWDSNFLMIESINEIEEDVKIMFTTKSRITGFELLNKYDIDYIFYGKVRRKYGRVSYLLDKCFEVAYENENVIIYKVLCKMRK